jgi:nucleotide-binding universal stress UspA family protein
MKTLLIPIDFSATSYNAVAFAAEWCKKYKYERIILFKTFYDSMFEYIFVSADYSAINQDTLNSQRDSAMEQLQDICKDLAEIAGPAVKVVTAVSELPLLRGLIEVIQNENPALIIVGSDNFNYDDAGIISRNIIGTAKASPVIVLVVPADYTYKPVEQALLPYNLNMLNDIDKLQSFRTFTLWHEIKLLVLNIDTTDRIIKVPNRFNEVENKFQTLLKDFKHEIYYSTEKNVINSINNFVKDHDVQLIIALPGKHSFLYSLTHQSISQAIYSNVKQPVLILK